MYSRTKRDKVRELLKLMDGWENVEYDVDVEGNRLELYWPSGLLSSERLAHMAESLQVLIHPIIQANLVHLQRELDAVIAGPDDEEEAA